MGQASYPTNMNGHDLIEETQFQFVGKKKSLTSG